MGKEESGVYTQKVIFYKVLQWEIRFEISF